MTIERVRALGCQLHQAQELVTALAVERRRALQVLRTDMTLQEIADGLGMTRQSVHRILSVEEVR